MLTANAQRARHLRPAIGWSTGFLATFTAVFAVAVLTPAGQYTDAFSFGAFDWLPPQASLVLAHARVVTPYVLCVAAVVLGVAGARRGFLTDAAVGVCAIIGAYSASGILKYVVLERPYFGDFGYTVNTYPSGHVAVSAMAGIMIVRMLFGKRVRVVAACAVIAAVTTVGIASVTTMAHRPSDVLGGLALAGIIAPWAARMHVASLRQLRTITHGPVGAVAAVMIGLTAVTPFAGVVFGTITAFVTATLIATWLVVWVATAIPVTPRPRPRPRPRGRRRPEA